MHLVEMERHIKDPVNYNRDYQQFIQNLHKFHGSKGTGFKRVPFFGGKDLDLFLLYKTVTSLGGFVKVTEEKKWREVAKCFNLPVSCTNAAFSLRQYYLRYLASYERFYFFGEDVDDAMAEMRKSSIAGSLQTSIINFGSMSSHNQYVDAPNVLKPGPFGEPRVNNFDRLVFSLKSGLPNEVDFALNICTLLSNVTNSIFNLAKAPTIIDLMLAHVGIFTDGLSSMRELYKEWYQDSDRDFIKFWRDSIDDVVLKEIYEGSCGMEDYSDAESHGSLLGSGICSRNTSITNSVEANRALQVCVILHNFSYERLNCMYISGHEAAKRFLIICAGTRLSSLRKCALDTLDNLADTMTLRIVQHKETQTYLRVLHSFLFCKDRARKVRALSIIAKLASHGENEDVLSEALSDDIYDELMKCLTIPDIQLILNALDALYYLSELGEATATAIVTVYRSIDILVCLVKVHAESYGNRAIAGFRIVENKNSIHAQKHASLQQNQRNVSQQIQRGPALASNPQMQMHMPGNQVRNSPKLPLQPNILPRHEQTKTEETEEVEPEIFAARWISAFYELAPGCEIRRTKILADYTESCKELGRKGVLNMQSFFKILGLVIPGQYWRQSDVDKDDLLITGIKQRAHPLIVKNRSVKTPARGPDVSSTHADQSLPIRPIPVAAINSHLQPQHLKLPINSMPTGVPAVPASAPVAISQSINQQGQQVLLSQPGLVQMQFQGPRQPLSSVSLPVAEGQAVNAISKQTDAQKMPLQLLQQHVNAQGIAQTAVPQNANGSSQMPQEASKQVLFPVPQVGVSQQVIGNQKFIPIQLVQSQFLQQLPQAQSQSILQSAAATATLVSQPKLLPAPSSGVVTTILNGPVQLSEAPSAQQQQTALDPKFTALQKTTAKEKHERKKAIKAARDIINADIRASNQDPLAQCQNLTDKIQKEMQQNFLQFHVHQQSIQAIQNQLQQVVLQNQQSKLPQNIMDDIHTRVRNHHTQMQVHYQKLQQLQMLLQQVQLRLTQEQKLTGKEPSNNTQSESATEKTTQPGFSTPRILRKQPAANLLDTPTTPLSTKIQPEVNSPLGIKPLSSLSVTPVSLSDAAVAAVTAAKQIFPNAASNITVPGNAQAMDVTNEQQQVLRTNLLTNFSALPSESLNPVNIASTQGMVASKSVAQQSMPGQTSSLAVSFVPNTINSSKNLPAAAFLNTTGNLVVSSKQFIQVPLATSVRPVIAQGAKPVSAMHQTPILPRPQQPSSLLASGATGQTIQTSALGGQTLLFTMPVSGISQQTLLPALTDNSAAPILNQQQAKMKQTSQPVLSTSHVLLQNSPVLENRAASNTIASVQTASLVKPIMESSSVMHGLSSAKTVLLQPKGNSMNTGNLSLRIQTPMSNDNHLNTDSLGSSGKAVHPQSTPVLGNGPIAAPVNQDTCLQTKTSAVISLPSALTGSVLTNGGVQGQQAQSLTRPSTSLPICTVGDLSSKTIPQNGIKQLKTMEQATVGIETIGLANVGRTSLTPNVSNRLPDNCTIDKLHRESSLKAFNVADSNSRTRLSDDGVVHKTIENVVNNKRTMELVSDSSPNIEHKKLKMNSDKHTSLAVDAIDKLESHMQDEDASSKQNNTKQRVNGMLADFSHQNGDANHTLSIDKDSELASSERPSASDSTTGSINLATSTEGTRMKSQLYGRNINVPKTDPGGTQVNMARSFTLVQNSDHDSLMTTADETSGSSTELVSSESSNMPKNTDNSCKSTKSEVGIAGQGNSEMMSRKKAKCEDVKRRQRTGKNCLWTGCNSCFSKSNDLLTHMVFTHSPAEGKLKSCKVPGCKPTQRPRGSMICHFKQVHCKTNSNGADDDQQITLPELLFPKVVDMEREDESPVTRSVRLTAALILRNIARNSALGRQAISAYESKLVLAAMSSSEASTAIAGCLEELSRKRRKTSDCIYDDEDS